MSDLKRRIGQAERLVGAARRPCATCAARPVFRVGGAVPAPFACPECGARIRPKIFTLDIGAAGGREGA